MLKKEEFIKHHINRLIFDTCSLVEHKWMRESAEKAWIEYEKTNSG